MTPAAGEDTGAFITPTQCGVSMTKSMTGSFYLTESVDLTAASADGSRVQDTIDLSAYVNVPTGQAIAIESVDFIVQRGSDHDSNVEAMLTAQSVSNSPI